MTASLHPIRSLDDQLAGAVTCASLAANHAVVANASTMMLVRLSGTAAVPVRDIALTSAPLSVAISPSERFVLAVDSRRARVWQRDQPDAIFDIAVDSSGTSVGAVFGRLGDRDVLLHEPAQAKLDAYELPTGRLMFTGSTETFLIERAISLAGGAYVALAGYFRGEGKGSLSVVPLTELEQPPEALFTRFRKKLPIADYAYRIAAGPCGADALVAFRDPEDDEDPDDDDDELVVDTSGTAVSTADVRRHRGFYVRGLDGSLRAKLAWDGPIKSYARLAASQSVIAAECDSEIALVPMTDPQGGSRVSARWLAAAPDGQRILVEKPDSGLALITLPT